MTRTTTRVLDVATTVPTTPLDPGTVMDGAPETGSRALAAVAGVEVGVWEMTPGTATDVEVDEVFVVLSGSGTVSFDDGERVHLGTGKRRTPAGWRAHHLGRPRDPAQDLRRLRGWSP